MIADQIIVKNWRVTSISSCLIHQIMIWAEIISVQHNRSSFEMHNETIHIFNTCIVLLSSLLNELFEENQFIFLSFYVFDFKFAVLWSLYNFISITRINSSLLFTSRIKCERVLNHAKETAKSNFFSSLFLSSFRIHWLERHWSTYILLSFQKDCFHRDQLNETIKNIENTHKYQVRSLFSWTSIAHLFVDSVCTSYAVFLWSIDMKFRDAKLAAMFENDQSSFDTNVAHWQCTRLH
jgi:hypothetical protein